MSLRAVLETHQVPAKVRPANRNPLSWSSGSGRALHGGRTGQGALWWCGHGLMCGGVVGMWHASQLLQQRQHVGLFFSGVVQRGEGVRGFGRYRTRTAKHLRPKGQTRESTDWKAIAEKNPRIYLPRKEVAERRAARDRVLRYQTQSAAKPNPQSPHRPWYSPSLGKGGGKGGKRGHIEKERAVPMQRLGTPIKSSSPPQVTTFNSPA